MVLRARTIARAQAKNAWCSLEEEMLSCALIFVKCK